MDAVLGLLVSLAVGLGYFASSARVIEQGNKALVERLGRYQRTLDPGLNFVIPFVDSLIVETMREREIDIKPQQVITKDGLSIEVDAVGSWRIVNLKAAYYNVDNLDAALANLVATELRARFGQIELEETFSKIEELNQTLLDRIDTVTTEWGIKVLRVAIQHIQRPEEIDRAMERTRIAERDRQAAVEEAEGKRAAAIAEAEGRKQAAIEEAEGIVQAVKLISAAMHDKPQSKGVLEQMVKFLVAQRYVDASQKISESPNSKVIFMDPKALTETVNGMMESEDSVPARHNHVHGKVDFADLDGPGGA
ncbi:MAG: SPFH/Band 7/PHB domain protein [Oscillatoriales cyanobacterium]|nr:MAG: SPFH/Band 7/PHB domain protein [Oscillatoriales cyanobacterium]